MSKPFFQALCLAFRMMVVIQGGVKITVGLFAFFLTW